MRATVREIGKKSTWQTAFHAASRVADFTGRDRPARAGVEK
jgi:hypothetical protein